MVLLSASAVGIHNPIHGKGIVLPAQADDTAISKHPSSALLRGKKGLQKAKYGNAVGNHQYRILLTVPGDRLHSPANTGRDRVQSLPAVGNEEIPIGIYGIL